MNYAALLTVSSDAHRQGRAGVTGAANRHLIFEAILRRKSVNLRSTRCEIRSPIHFHRYAINYVGSIWSQILVCENGDHKLRMLYGEIHNGLN